MVWLGEGKLVGYAFIGALILVRDAIIPKL
jgi:hypothetical protein